MTIFVLSIFLGLLSVANKILLLCNRRSGWTSGMLIGILSSVFFYLIDLKILAAAEIGFFLVMLYGYLSKKKHEGTKGIVLNLVLTFILAALSVSLFTGDLTVYQLVSSLSFIWGGYTLAVGQRPLGWSLLLLAHVATSLAAFRAEELVFSGLQLVSGLVCVYALAGMLWRSRQRA